MKTNKSSLATFKRWLIIVVGSIGVLFALFYILTQWKIITVSTEEISVIEIYQGPNEIIIYRLNIPDDRYASSWEFQIQDDGSGYHIPKKSIIELHKNVIESQLNHDYQIYDHGEMNNAQLVTGGPAITQWYIGAPGDAVLVWKEGMELEPAPYEILEKCGLHVLVE